MPLVSKTFSQIITFTRASSATYFDAAGVLQTATTDVPRFDYNSSTLAPLGFLIEESRTNNIRNNTMQGAAAGTPGTAPTNWTISSPSDGVDANVIGTGTQNGVTYIDVQFVGTSGTGSTSTRALFESNTQIVAANGQTWTGSARFSLVGGSLTNVSVLALRTRFLSAAGAELTGQNVSLTSITATPQRIANTFAATDATTAFVNLGLSIDYVNSSAVDFTLRIGLPQLEQGAFATSVIPTTTTAVTRAADVASVNTLSPWFNAAEGTLFGEFSSFSGALRAIVALTDGTVNNRVQFFSNAGNPYTIASRISSSGTGTSPADTGSIALNAVGKAAIAYAVGSAATSVNGAAPTTSSPVAVPVGINALGLGSAPSITNMSGYLRRVTYYPRRLSNAELQTLTT